MSDDAELARLFEQGLAQHRAGQHRAAIQIFHVVLKRGGASAAVHCHIAECYEQLRDPQRADSAYRAAIEIEPDASEAYVKAAGLAQRASAFAARVGQAETARDLREGAFSYLNLLAGRLMIRGAWHDAENVSRRALTLAPANWAAHVDLGQCLYQTLRHRAAEAAIREGIRLAPTESMAHYHLGATLLRQGRASEAEAALRQALVLSPSLAPAKSALADALRAQGLAAAADLLYEGTLGQESESGLYLMAPIYTDFGSEEIMTRHRAWGARAVAAVRPTAAEGASFANSHEPGRRLRVGVVSPDFKTHSVAYFVEPLLAHHDRNALETFCYAEMGLPDETTERLKAMASQWRMTGGLDDAAFRRQVREDGIDILIDLAGHTIGNRLSAFAVKPAPVTASWLGYPATTGLDTIEWRITDEIADPPGAEAHHVERLIRLDRAFLCFLPPAEAPEVGPLPAAATDRVTFGSFNNLLKITPSVVDAWADILRGVPESRLIIKSLLLRDGVAQQRLRDRFAASGIPASRIDLRGATNDRVSHLSAYGEIDIALDTFPYNGTATTCEALWMGVPVVTLTGNRHSGRVGCSLLTSAGLSDLVQPDQRHYVDFAVRMAADLPSLAARRAALRRQVAASALCDATGFARSFETALRRMWVVWLGGELNQPNVIL